MNIKTIMIVDDEQLMRDVVVEMLKDRADKIIPAESGQEALDLLAQPEQVDIVITDMRMPGISGYQLLEKIKAKNPSIPVVIMTGYDEAFGPEKVIRTGAEEYITKPFKKDEINLMVNRAIWRAASKRENILLKYITAANRALAESDDPDREKLLNVGKAFEESISTLLENKMADDENQTQPASVLAT